MCSIKALTVSVKYRFRCLERAGSRKNDAQGWKTRDASGAAAFSRKTGEGRRLSGASAGSDSRHEDFVEQRQSSGCEKQAEAKSDKIFYFVEPVAPSDAVTLLRKCPEGLVSAR